MHSIIDMFSYVPQFGLTVIWLHCCFSLGFCGRFVHLFFFFSILFTVSKPLDYFLNYVIDFPHPSPALIRKWFSLKKRKEFLLAFTHSRGTHWEILTIYNRFPCVVATSVPGSFAVLNLQARLLSERHTWHANSASDRYSFNAHMSGNLLNHHEAAFSCFMVDAVGFIFFFQFWLATFQRRWIIWSSQSWIPLLTMQRYHSEEEKNTHTHKIKKIFQGLLL